MNTITYKHHIWPDGAAYLNLPDGLTSRIRVKKLLDGDEIKNLDRHILLSELENFSERELQNIIDTLIDIDEANDAAQIARESTLVKGTNDSLDARLKNLTVKARTGASTQRDKDANG